MAAKILDGKALSERLIDGLALKIEKREQAGLRRPALTVVLVGKNPASQVYVRNKQRACERAGIDSKLIELETTINQQQLLEIVFDLNRDATVDGILVQLPLPEHLDEEEITETINPNKDVDGFHPYNMGKLVLKLPGLRPCTPKGVMKLLVKSGIDLVGKDAVIIGQSNIVGRPMALELLKARCTITVCHSKTKDLAAKAAAADILVVAIGRAEYVPADWIKPGAIVIDVGINRRDDGKLVGDVDFGPAAEKASWITPVPGGAGPMTVACLLENTLQAAEIHDATANST